MVLEKENPAFAPTQDAEELALARKALQLGWQRLALA